ncbi:MAG: NnrS family protein [Roseibium sp.]|uniref:NnrS family protein n=1 Tax=Roseibium sp. TaxID=1936156 RepID=UPI0026077C43|nr:NnrS family protein [Roseibium sp.]MCV0429215.1 NnrS family protein [Roseibium sp.]
MAAASHPHSSRTVWRYPTFLTAGFRFYFLAAGIFSVFAMLAWTVWLSVHAAGGAFVSVPMGMAPHLWHAHEMVYGYTIAVMAGFFITAVPNWTGSKEAGAVFVSVSGLVWVLGRLSVWFSGSLDPVIVAVVDLAFIPILATSILGRLAQKAQLRNAVFLFLLSALFTGNLLMHLEWIGWTERTAASGVRLGLFISAAMIVIIGGRVVPAFTRNALNRIEYAGSMPVSHPWFDRAGILLALLAAVSSVVPIPETALGLICLGAGAVNMARLAGWKGWATLKSPILWILHVAFLLLTVGYIVYGFSLLFDLFSETAALHLLAAGAVGGMTLAMMTRASLGHSGRPLKVSLPIALAYLSVIAAALLRTFGTQILDYFPVMIASGLLWMIAFVLFTWVYFPILTKPRSR